jgi:hypothetical protein
LKIALVLTGPERIAAGRVEPASFFREDRHARVDGLHDVVWTGGEAVVRGISQGCRALGAFEADAHAVEARDQHCWRPRA